MKKIFLFLMLAVGLLFVACSDDGEGYDADTAVSNYIPVLGGRKVASVHTTSVYDGRDYSWKHNFVYDKQGRIKEVNSEIKHHRLWTQTVTGERHYRLCNITSNAKYYYNGEFVKIAYSVERDYPTYPAWNYSYSFIDAGLLNENGHIVNYTLGDGSGFECDYNFTSLKSVTFDGGYVFDILRDSKGNVNGHKFTGFDIAGDDSTSVKQGRYEYTSIENKTNFDFSAYLGYWEHERYISALSDWPYASYQLAAFGFFGSCSENLPMCAASSAGNGASASKFWTFKDGYPVTYTDASGRVTEITYVE